MMRWIESLLELLYPRRAVCMGCGSMLGCDRDDFCEDCREKLARNWVGLRPADQKLGVDGAAFAHVYRGPAGGAVRNLKYRSVRLLADAMGRDIARCAEGLRLPADALVIPVPMHPRRQKRRGFNHAHLLAERSAEKLNLNCADALMRTRNVRQQARLSREERLQNMQGVFAVRPEYAQAVCGGTVLIIDDVLTTGATAAACARALKEAGAQRIYFAAYAYGERKQNG